MEKQMNPFLLLAFLQLMLLQPPPVDNHPELPPLAALDAFPFTHEQCEEQSERYARHKEYLEGLDETLHPQKEKWLAETEHHWDCWLFLSQAKNPKQSEYGIRSSLRALLDDERLGEKKFWKGDMPPLLELVMYPAGDN
jgi:hypothetical protein